MPLRGRGKAQRGRDQDRGTARGCNNLAGVRARRGRRARQEVIKIMTQKQLRQQQHPLLSRKLPHTARATRTTGPLALE
jgi:hypothetical protein